MRRFTLHSTTIVLVIASLSASGAAAQRTTSRSASGEDFVWTGTMGNGATLAIKNFNGPIDVRAGSGDRVEVRAEKRSNDDRARDLTFETRKDGENVTVCSVWRGESACDDGRRRDRNSNDDGNLTSARITVLLPRGARLDANTGNGAVSVVDVGGDVKVNTGNGEVRVEGTAGAVNANTGNGALTISDARGRVQANTGNGRVRIATTSGPVNVNTGSGDIDVRIGTMTRDADMEFHTGNGNVVVTVPSGVDADFDATTGNGSVRSDFEIRVQGSITPHRLRGTIGRGGPSLRMTTGNGSVELRKGS